jgi:hypothetical protein
LSDALELPRHPTFSGFASYYDVVPGGSTVDPRIYLRLRLGEGSSEFLAMVDTAAPWCILEPDLAKAVEGDLEGLPDLAVIDSRLGRFTGRLYRGRTTLLAEVGESLSVDATFFLSKEWTGGNFVGYQGFLERLRFAVDPALNRFFFSHL